MEKACRMRYCGKFTVSRTVRVAVAVIPVAAAVIPVAEMGVLPVAAMGAVEAGTAYSTVYSLRSKRNCSTRLEYLAWYNFSNCSRSASSSRGSTTSFH